MRVGHSLGVLAAATFIALGSNAAWADPAVPGVTPATEQADVPIPGVTPVYSAGAPGSEVRLTPEQVRKVLDDAARRNKEPTVRTATVAEEKPCPTKPHGEMGVEAGTGGYGAMYGAVVVPLGCHGSAAIAFETGTYNGGYRGRR